MLRLGADDGPHRPDRRRDEPDRRAAREPDRDGPVPVPDAKTATSTTAGTTPGCSTAALGLIGYDSFREEQRRAREEGKYLGICVCVAVEPGGRNGARDLAIFPSGHLFASGGVNGATIRLERSGVISLFLGSTNCGQSHETTTSQLVCDVLGVTPENISVISPFDSEISPWGSAAANSGNNFHLYDIGAVNGAALKLKEKILILAAHLLQADAEELQIDEKGVFVRGTERRVTFQEMGRIAYGNQARMPAGFEPGMQATNFYTFPHAEPFAVP